MPFAVADPTLPKDRPFFAVDAYGEVQHVEYCAHTSMDTPHEFGGAFGILESDGKLVFGTDITDWHDDASVLTARMGNF